MGKEYKRTSYLGKSEAFEKVYNNLLERKYRCGFLSEDGVLVFGSIGIVFIKTIDESGNYEYKEGKWYKDGKECKNYTAKLQKITARLSKSVGKNRAIIAKTFEGGSVNGMGSGYFVVDISKEKGADRLIEEIVKTINPPTSQKELSKKRERVLKAFQI